VNERVGSPVTTVVGSSPVFSRLRSRSKASKNSLSCGTGNLQSGEQISYRGVDLEFGLTSKNILLPGFKCIDI